MEQVRALAADLGDEIFLIRVIWLEGRIAAGLGQTAESARLLEQARQEFARREKWYDVALADVEWASLLLAEGQTARVKELTAELVVKFQEKGIHREALAALQLFHEAAEREKATAELARQVLEFLFRARWDGGCDLGRSERASETEWSRAGSLRPHRVLTCRLDSRNPLDMLNCRRDEASPESL